MALAGALSQVLNLTVSFDLLWFTASLFSFAAVCLSALFRFLTNPRTFMALKAQAKG